MRLELSERIRRDEIFAFLEIDADALKSGDNSPLMQLLRKIGAINSPTKNSSSEETPADILTADKKPSDPATAKGKGEKSDDGHDVPVRLYTQNITYNEIGQWLMQSVNQAAFALRLEDAGLNPAAVAAAACPVDYQELGPFTRSSGGEIRKGDQGSRGLSFFIPFALVMLMFMSIMIVCQPMLTSVIEEKQQRIAEVLLGSVSPFQLMMGKLAGNVGVALTIVAVYLLGGYFLAHYYGYTEMLPVRILAWFIAFEVLASLLFGARVHRHRRRLHGNQGSPKPDGPSDDRSRVSAHGVDQRAARAAEQIRDVDFAFPARHAHVDDAPPGRLAHGATVATDPRHCFNAADDAGLRVRRRPRVPHWFAGAGQSPQTGRTGRLDLSRVAQSRPASDRLAYFKTLLSP